MRNSPGLFRVNLGALRYVRNILHLNLRHPCNPRRITTFQGRSTQSWWRIISRMSARSTNYMQAIEHLPAGALLVFQSVGWEEYEQVLEDLVDRPGIRATYDRGRLEIMSPLREHEALKEFVLSLVRILAEELDVDLESCGSTTFKKKEEAKGTEPDTCFYVANAGRIIGKRTADLHVDPPPDIVVEIDVTNESSTKLPIYATFGVPEVWRYNAKRNRVQICELRDRSYVEIAASLSFPILTADVLPGFMEQSQTQGQKRALAAFRRWTREHI